jgi:uncharacterized membrane protein
MNIEITKYLMEIEMNTKSKVIKLIGFIFIILVGTLSHFLYEWSNEISIVGFIAPVNESIWEHLKLLFFPTILYSLLEYGIYGKEHSNYITSITFGLIVGLLSIIIMYYTYSGIIGHNVTFIDILIFLISVIISQLISYTILKKNSFVNFYPANSILILVGITLLLFIFTFKPPMIDLFKDSTTNTYGIFKAIKK